LRGREGERYASGDWLLPLSDLMRDACRPYESLLASLSRRELLNITWRLGLAAVLQPVVSRTVLAQPMFAAYPFPLGVASGDPLPDGVVLWTRLAPEPLDGGGMPMSRVEVGWEIAHDRMFAKVVRKGTVVARPELGHSVHVEASGLDPGREYFYRFRCGGEVSQVGRTKTAPAEGAVADAIRFAVCGCNHYEAGYFTAFRHLANEQFDFVFHTGDYIYENRGDAGRNPALVRQHRGQEIFTLVDYRNRYAQYKSDPDLMAAHASAPFIMTWDDHEVDNDYAGMNDENNTPPEAFLLRRTAAYQAYYENMPLRASTLPAGPHMRLYRRLVFGNLIDLSVLDTRQYRSPQACGGGTTTRCAEEVDPVRTIVGAEQEKWLFTNLTAARARWTVLGQQVPTFARDNAGRFAMDKWDGYTVSRRRLYTQLRDTKAPNPIVLSGDVHTHWGADLKLDFANPKSEIVGVEFTNTSITSGGDGSDVQANWNQLHANNPHITYHSARRGYIACTASQKAMRADFRILDKVTTADMPVRTGGSLVVEAGRAGSLKA
jgi:alkaline phosphatase D